ncbi:MAG: anthranilate synthase component 1 [Proteobacteria bacterium]|nr:anthranilate synthase component 1 [Cystobacterineae bacterium]MCL2315261.1 anthranilate synthase component 1 [Pseudomonadota bacterium]
MKETIKDMPPPRCIFLKGVHAGMRPLCCMPEPLALFARLSDNGRRPHTVLLESAEPSSRKTQKSLLVVSSALSIICRGAEVVLTALNAQGKNLLPALGEHFERFSPRLEEGVLRLRVPTYGVANEKTSERERLQAESSLTVLRELAELLRAALPAMPEALFLVGAFAYDLVEQFENLPKATAGSDFPDYHFYLADRMIVFNHLNACGHILACTFSATKGGEEEGEGADRAAEARAAETEAALAEIEEAVSLSTEALPACNLRLQATLDAVQTDVDDGTFAAQVENLKKHIVCGDVFQIVLSRTFSMPCQNPFEAYHFLRTLNPSPYLFYMHSGEFTLLGASPESAVKVDGKTRRVEISPIAGTRRRGLRGDGFLDVDLDGRIEAELRLDEKENAEHMMLVDLARNDVARVSKPGTRYVSELLRTERYSHVMHLVSRICGELREELDALHAYQANMNMGTLTGAPKIKAMQLLRHYEYGRRGHYGGAIGYLSGDGSFDTAILIRTALVQNGVAHIRAGAGVVCDSVPLMEADETRRKAEAVLRAVALAEAKQQQNIQRQEETHA